LLHEEVVVHSGVIGTRMPDQVAALHCIVTGTIMRRQAGPPGD
jgi:hypothetical protein